ncbi:MAG: hypothetical protein DWQ07_11980 [Chloroflexi bacterium]|nr:MAG: hypothetical protein DWQ07_11980 [Chloroflexota bacterium]MBL1196077.1 hypothetical protein [Chloroflexota bacterium]NOH13371.1 segregation/condensation protein A [Chloroflexota bacterium]
MPPTMLEVPTEQSAYEVATPLYEGPLDLLLQLIERAELDVTKLALAQVTDQFLSYIKSLQEKAAEEVSGFLVIASRLMQIKSEALLPRPPEREPGEEDPGDALVQQLLNYKRYKELADLFGERHASGLRTYLRLAAPPKVEGKLDLSGLTANDLYLAAKRAFEILEEREPLNKVVSRPKVTIRDKIKQITQRLSSSVRTTFNALLGEERSRVDVVVTFLAMLELVKRFHVTAKQDDLFGEIELERSENWDDNADFEIEFAE